MRFNVVIGKNRWRFDVEVRKHTCTRTNNRVETRGLSLTWHDYYGAKTHSIPSFFLHNQSDLMCKLKKTAYNGNKKKRKKTVFFSLLKRMSKWAHDVYAIVNNMMSVCAETISKFYTCFWRLHLAEQLIVAFVSNLNDTVNYGLLSQTQLCQAVHLTIIHITSKWIIYQLNALWVRRFHL